MNWLVFSILASVGLTVVLNVVPRMIPGASDRVTRRIETWTAAHPDDSSLPRRRVKVVFPWKAMLIGSLLLTLILNALARLGD